MSCQLLKCCQFFKDNMKDLPKSAEYIKSKLCFGDYEKCKRYRIYKEFSSGSMPFDLLPDDAEEAEKMSRCVRKKQLSDQ